MKDRIKELLREHLLPEADNRKKIIKFGGSPELADWAHNISDKFSVWIANAIIKNNLDFKQPHVKHRIEEVVNLFKTQNKPSIDIKNLTLSEAYGLIDRYHYISDWINNPNTPPVDLRNMTWDEAYNLADEWHENLEAKGEVEGITKDAELVHKFPDGYAWFLTKSNTCDASQASMGHCATASRSDMYLLRLIKGNEEFVTADWHPEDKYIMQMKGKQNQKPIPKYYPYIEWLIKSDMVNELKTNQGYRPDTNFKVTDLPPDEVIEIFNTKPSLINSNDILTLLNTPSLRPKILNTISDEDISRILDVNPDRIIGLAKNLINVDPNQIYDLMMKIEKQVEVASLLGKENLDKLNGGQIYWIMMKNRDISNLKKLIEIMGADNIKKMSENQIDNIIFNSFDSDKANELFGQITNQNPQPVHENIIRKILREGILTKTKDDVIKVTDFINFAKKYLGINDDIKVALAYEKTPDIKTSAYYNLDGFVKVYVKDRAIMDVCRSIAHELTHHKQNLDGRLKDAVKDGEDGSELENEANAKAGEIIRKWGKLNPDLYN